MGVDRNCNVMPDRNRPSRRAVLSLAATAALVAGCNQTNRPASDALAVVPNAPAQTSLDPTERRLSVLGLRVLQLDLPRGRASGNRELWHRIDETALDPAAYDTLYANGVRVGVAPVAEIDHVRGALGLDTATTLDILGKAPGLQRHEIEIESGVFEKTIFWLDADKRSKGRTFQRCRTLLAVAFEPAPGRPDEAVRLTITPVVRSTEPEMVVTRAGSDMIVTREIEETLLDLQLVADVDFGSFLIVAPSEQQKWRTSVGRQFFCQDVPGEVLERVYVIVPQVVAQKAVTGG